MKTDPSSEKLRKHILGRENKFKGPGRRKFFLLFEEMKLVKAEVW